MTINPKDAKPDQVYLVKYDKENCIGVRNHLGPNYTTSWTLASLDDFAYSWDGVEDSKVSDLVPLMPARNITRDDLPAWAEVEKLVELAPWKTSTVEVVLDTVVAHLNENGGVPDEKPQKSDYVLNNGKCCEEAHLASIALDCKNEELSKAQEEIAAQKKRAKAERVERERLSAVVDGLNEALGRQNVKAAEFRHRAERAETERDKLKQEFSDAIEVSSAQYNELQAKLDAAEGWPEWMGPKPERRIAKRSPLGLEVDGLTFFGDKSIETYEGYLKSALLDATRYAAVIEAKKSEQAATDDKDQRVEEWAWKAAHIMAQSACDELGQPYEVFDMLVERLMPRGRALVDAGWTPPESEEK